MDKELALIIAEMLIKQNETTEQIKNLNSHSVKTNEAISTLVEYVKTTNDQVDTLTKQVVVLTEHANETTNQIKETNSILKELMGVSVKQWQQQQTFNELMFNEL